MRKSHIKKEIFYKERDESERVRFIDELSKIPEAVDVVYVDESGIQKEMNPTHGRAKRGVKLYQEISGKRIKKDNVIAGWLNGLILGMTENFV